MFEPALTSIEQNVDELSDAALSIMFRRLNELVETQDDSKPIQVVLEPRMVKKNSVRKLND